MKFIGTLHFVASDDLFVNIVIQIKILYLYLIYTSLIDSPGSAAMEDKVDV